MKSPAPSRPQKMALIPACIFFVFRCAIGAGRRNTGNTTAA